MRFLNVSRQEIFLFFAACLDDDDSCCDNTPACEGESPGSAMCQVGDAGVSLPISFPLIIGGLGRGYKERSSGGSKGGARDARPPSGPKFLHIHAVFRKNWPNNRLAPPSFGVSAPSSGKSWIRHCDRPLWAKISSFP